MTIAEAQKMVDDWIKEIGNGYFSELTNMAVLTEEIGELARVISRTYGDQRPKPGEFPRGAKAAVSEEGAEILRVPPASRGRARGRRTPPRRPPRMCRRPGRRRSARGR